MLNSESFMFSRTKFFWVNILRMQGLSSAKHLANSFFMNLLYVKLKGNQCSTLSLGLHSNSDQPAFLGWRMWVAAVFREGEQMLLKNMAYESIEQ